MRILIVTEIPAPFRIPLFNALARAQGVELQVAFLAEEDPRRTHFRVYRGEFAFDEVVLRGVGLHRGSRWFMFNRGVLGLLRRTRPDAILLGGWNQPAFWQVLVAARAMRTPVLLWVESTERDARVGGVAAQRARRAAVRLAAGFVVPGSASREYLRGLGVPEQRIAVAPNAIDLRIFGKRADRTAVRERLGLDGCVFLYVGRLEVGKGVDVLVNAMREVRGTLVLIGSGLLEGELRASAGERVRVVGPLQRDELPPWYAAADVFVLPSRSEPWGMVLNEAAAAGLPLVATEAVGAAHDLIEPGGNGCRVPADDAEALAQALRALEADAELRRVYGERSREVVEGFRPEAWADAVIAAARSAARRNAD
jgi:glycosyltransferase involved in cell wall biosynthesis